MFDKIMFEVDEKDKRIVSDMSNSELLGLAFAFEMTGKHDSGNSIYVSRHMAAAFALSSSKDYTIEMNNTDNPKHICIVEALQKLYKMYNSIDIDNEDNTPRWAYNALVYYSMYSRKLANMCCKCSQ